MLAPNGQAGRLQRRSLSHLRSPCSRPSRRLSGPPSSASSPLPYPYRVIGMVMIAFVGVATFDKPGTGATSILQAVIWVSPKRQLRNATLAPSCSYYASCAAARGAVVGALGSQTVVMTYRIPRHIGCSPHRSKYRGEEALLSAVEWSREGKPIATLALRVVVLGLLQLPA
jgi:hypothetical protein